MEKIESGRDELGGWLVQELDVRDMKRIDGHPRAIIVIDVDPARESLDRAVIGRRYDVAGTV